MSPLKHRFSRIGWDYFWRCLIVVSLGIGITASVESRENSVRAREIAQCQFEYNEANNQRSAALVSVTESERQSSRRADDALGAFVKAAVDPSTNTDKTLMNKLFVDLNLAYSSLATDRVNADRARLEHPVLDPPTVKC